MFMRKWVVLGVFLVTFVGLPFFVSAAEENAKDAIVKELSAMLDKKPEMITSFIYAIGDEYVKDNKLDEAVALYEKALTISPKNEDILNRLASLATQKQDHAKAAGIYRKLIEIKPDNVWYYSALSEALKNAGEEDKAKDVWDERLKNSTNTELFVQAGNFYANQGNMDKAIETVRKAVEISPDSINLLQNLESLYMRAEKFDEAEKVCYQVLSKSEEQWAQNWANSELINIYQRQGKTDELADKFEAELEKKPDDIGLYKKLADLYERAGNREEAVMVYEDAITAGLEDREINHKLMELYEQTESYDKAIAQTNKIIESSPEDNYLYERLANVQAKSGKKEEAKKTWEMYISKSQKNAGIFSRYGDRLSDWGDFEGAIAQYRKAQALEPENPVYDMRVADKLMVLNKLDEAKKELNSVIAKTEDEWMKEEAERKMEELNARMNIPKKMPEAETDKKSNSEVKPEVKPKVEAKVEVEEKTKPEVEAKKAKAEEKTEEKKPEKKKKRGWFSW